MSTGVRTRMSACLAGLLLILSASIVAAQAPNDDPDTTIALRALEHLRFEAQQQKDRHTLNEIFDDLLLLVDQDGTLLSKGQFLGELHNSGTTSLRIIPESMAVRVFDGLVIVVGIYDERGIKAGRPYRQHCRFIDTWMLKKGKWVCIASTATSAVA